MRQRISFAWSAACIAALMLAACGGGGGGGGVAFPIVPLPAATVALNGTATYDYVPNPNGRLVYADTTARPVRAAMVDVLDATSGASLATAITDENGAYSATVPASTNMVVRVRAQMTRSGAGPTWDVSVRDNTQAGALYSMQSSSFSSGTTDLARDLRAASGWGGNSYTGTRVSAPFAVMDTIYTAMQKVMTVAPASAFPALKVYWSVNNVSSSGNVALGQITTTSFVASSTGATIYVLGKADVDTDEFDAPVIAHEWGHYYQSSFSRDDSPGGHHAIGQRSDRRLAFSEGWGNGWSGIALGRTNYVDSLGAGQQAVGANIDLSTGPVTNAGWFSEQSIETIFWTLNQRVGFKPIHDAMTSVPFKNGTPVTSIHPYTAAFNAVAPGSASALAGLLTAQNISAAANDPYGAQETNAGGTPAITNVLPMYTVPAAPGAGTPACVSNTEFDQYGDNNKLGAIAYVHFTAPATRSYTVTIGAPAGALASFDIFSNGFIPHAGNTLSLAAGDYVLAVKDLNRSSATTCFSVAIQ